VNAVLRMTSLSYGTMQFLIHRISKPLHFSMTTQRRKLSTADLLKIGQKSIVGNTPAAEIDIPPFFTTENSAYNFERVEGHTGVFNILKLLP
jgi:hypothetical protein